MMMVRLCPFIQRNYISRRNESSIPLQIHGRRTNIGKLLESDPRAADSVAGTPDEKMKITVAETKGKIYEIETTLPPLL